MKKSIILMSMLYIAFGAAAQGNKKNGHKNEEATLTVDIPGLTDTVIKVYYGFSDPLQKAVLRPEQGKLVWRGHVASPGMAVMLFSKGRINFFIENSKMVITGNANVFSSIRIKGSATNDEHERFIASVKDLTDESTAIRRQYGKVPKNELPALEQRQEELKVLRRSRIFNYIAAHPASAVSVHLVTDGAMDGEFGIIDSAYHLLSAAVLQTEAGRVLTQRMPVIKRGSTGEQIIDFQQADTSGNMTGLADFKGKYVLVDFWASWCAPCRAENPNILKVYNDWKDKHFTVIGVSLDEKAAPWKAAIVKDGLPWTQVSDLKGWKNELANYYQIKAIPFNFLIDPDGKIVAKDLKAEALQKKLTELIGK